MWEVKKIIMDERIYFTQEELQLFYAACLSYGNELTELAKKIPNEPQIADLLSRKAKKSWSVAVKIANYLDD